MADDKADEKKEEIKEETIRDVVEEVYAEETEEVEEPTKEEPKEEVKEEPDKPEIDAQEITDAAKEKGKQEVKEEILKALGVTKEEKEEAESAGYETPWEKRGEPSPASWQEAVEAGADLADFRRQETLKQQQQYDEKVEEQKAQTRQQLNEYWDTQLAELRAAGKIPEVSDAVKEKLKSGKPLSEQERQDPGIMAQTELFKTMETVTTDRKNKGMDPIYNIKEVFYEHYENRNLQPAGADAPISGGTKTPITSSSDEELSYEDIHNADIEEIIRGG